MDEFNLRFVIFFVLFILSIPILIACMFLHTEKNTTGEYESDIENSN